MPWIKMGGGTDKAPTELNLLSSEVTGAWTKSG